MLNGRILGALIMTGALMIASPASPAAGAARRQVRILGGTTAAPGQFPWMAALVDSSEPHAADGLFCGATVIAPQVLMTAAHCVEGTSASEIDAVTGRTLLSRDGDGQRIRVKQVVRHPNWNPTTHANDVALLQLSQPTTATALTLAGPGDAGLEATNQPVRVAGWGTTSSGGSPSNELRYVRLYVRSPAVCDSTYGGVDRAKIVCAGSPRANEDSCQGDSGGPLFGGDGAAMRVLGIVSFGAGCGQAGVPGVYTRVSAFESWIITEVAALSSNAPAPAPAPNPPTIRIGNISCSINNCTIEIRASGRPPAGGIVLDIVRKRSRGRRAIDRLVFARQVSVGRWIARTNLPLGHLTLYAAALNKAQNNVDGSGDVQTVSVSLK